MNKKTKDKKGFSFRENIEAVTMAIAIALLFKVFILEVSKIPSGSMQPTLMGNPTTQVFDRVLVDKLSFQFRDPERFEIVVFKHPLERSRVMVKRLVGMPGEELRIAHGDLWVRPLGSPGEAPWTVLRRPESVVEEHWRRLDPSDPPRPTWKSTSDGWRTMGRSVRARGNGVARYQGTIRDRYTDGYPESLQAAIDREVAGREVPHGRNDVGDVRLQGSLTALGGTESVSIELREGTRTYEFRLPGPAAAGSPAPQVRIRDAEAARTAERVEEGSPWRLEAGRAVSFEARNLDDRLRLVLDGETVLETDIDHAEAQAASLALRVRGDGADFEDLVVARDIYYIPQGLPGAEVAIPAGNYFMLGDNTLDSADGRDWRKKRMIWTDEEGVEHEQWGNYRDGENPVVGTDADGVAWRGHRNVWGDRLWFEKAVATPGLEEVHVPLVPRDLIQGRALAIFWPLKPFQGLYRLGWLP